MNIFKIITRLIIFLPLIASAQDYVNQDSVYIPNGKKFYPEYHLNIGSSLTYFQKGVAGSNMFIAPSFSIPINNKFSFTGGLIASINNLPGFPLNEFNLHSQRFNNLSVFGTTTYQVTSKFMIYASGIKQISNSTLPSQISYFPQNSFDFGSSFKIGKGITIGASIHMSNNYNLYSTIPYGLNDNFPIIW